MVILASQKSFDLITMLWNSAVWNRNLDKQCFCILWSFQMMSSKSKLKFVDTSKLNKLEHDIESENQHYAQDFKQQFHHSYRPYLGHFLRGAVAVFWLGVRIKMLEVIKHYMWSASDTSGPWEFFWKSVNLSAVWPIKWKSVKIAVSIELL